MQDVPFLVFLVFILATGIVVWWVTWGLAYGRGYSKAMKMCSEAGYFFHLKEMEQKHGKLLHGE